MFYLPLWRGEMSTISIQVELRGEQCVVLKSFTLGGVTIPTGFISDGLSKQWWMVWLDRFGVFFPSALVHDYCQEKYGYHLARDYFRQALIEQGASKTNIFILTSGVAIRDWQRRNF